MPEFSLDRHASFNLRTPGSGRSRFSFTSGWPAARLQHSGRGRQRPGAGLQPGGNHRRRSDKCTGAPGRFERVPHDGDFAVVVDYAHSDDALLNVLRTAREVTKGRIITLFGCGGDRDGSKRAPMGEAAGQLERRRDSYFRQSAHRRSRENTHDAEVGIQKTGKPYEKIADRREAIHRAIAQARANDLVLIAGKGHEDYQIIGREVFHFDDKEVAREALSAAAK